MWQDLDPSDPQVAIDDAISRPWRENEKTKAWREALKSGFLLDTNMESSERNQALYRDAKVFIVRCGENQLRAIKSLEQSIIREAGM